jgi:hypothetical protein
MANNDAFDPDSMEETEEVEVENVDPQQARGPEWDHVRQVMVNGKTKVQCVYCCKNMAVAVSATRIRLVYPIVLTLVFVCLLNFGISLS